jgi:DNA-binding HxlR family transcriptional regulator
MTLTAKKSAHPPKDRNLEAFEAISSIGAECRLLVVTQLLVRPMRFHELLQTGIHPKTLARTLKYFLTREIVQREVLSTQPFAVQYRLTEKGTQLESIIIALNTWGERWIQISDAPPRKQSPSVTE